MSHKIKIGPMFIRDDGRPGGAKWDLQRIGVEIESTPVYDRAFDTHLGDPITFKTGTKPGDPDEMRGYLQTYTLHFPEGSQWVRRPKDPERHKGERDARGSILVVHEGKRYLCTFIDKYGVCQGSFGRVHWLKEGQHVTT